MTISCAPCLQHVPTPMILGAILKPSKLGLKVAYKALYKCGSIGASLLRENYACVRRLLYLRFREGMHASVFNVQHVSAVLVGLNTSKKSHLYNSW